MSDKIEQHLDGIDAERRAALVTLLRGAVFVAPAIATYGLAGRKSLVTSAAYMTEI